LQQITYHDLFHAGSGTAATHQPSSTIIGRPWKSAVTLWYVGAKYYWNLS